MKSRRTASINNNPNNKVPLKQSFFSMNKYFSVQICPCPQIESKLRCFPLPYPFLRSDPRQQIHPSLPLPLPPPFTPILPFSVSKVYGNHTPSSSYTHKQQHNRPLTKPFDNPYISVLRYPFWLGCSPGRSVSRKRRGARGRGERGEGRGEGRNVRC